MTKAVGLLQEEPKREQCQAPRRALYWLRLELDVREELRRDRMAALCRTCMQKWKENKPVAPNAAAVDAKYDTQLQNRRKEVRTHDASHEQSVESGSKLVRRGRQNEGGDFESYG
jgi:hypothetical protein